AGLFAQAALLGWVGTALVAGLVIALVAAALVEMAGIARLGRIDGLRALAEAGYGGDAAAAQRALTGLRQLLRPQAAAADGLARLEAAASDTPDPVERLALAESLVLSPLDAQASAAVEAAARRVAAATAVLPLPILDVAVVLASTLSMIRAVAAAYGGRAGWLGSWRLLKAVAAQLVASGLISATDDLLDPVIGQGIAGRLSKRLGEATFNAAITARVGVIAMSVCRPLPFAETPPPRARTILWRSIGDWQSKSSPE
ncbi:MAG: TIGR01620 family protein, partial [Pseudomonadota bacterium]